MNIKRLRNRIGNNKGTTMLETMVAFVVLMVILGVLYNIIAFCSELKMSATDINSSMQDFTLEVYSKTPNSEKIEHNSYQPAPTGNSRKPLFYLEDENNRIPLSNLGAETYAYKNSDSNTKSIDPKTMTFTHKADE